MTGTLRAVTIPAAPGPMPHPVRPETLSWTTDDTLMISIVLALAAVAVLVVLACWWARQREIRRAVVGLDEEYRRLVTESR